MLYEQNFWLRINPNFELEHDGHRFTGRHREVQNSKIILFKKILQKRKENLIRKKQVRSISNGTTGK